jgi:carbonic anhydrase
MKKILLLLPFILLLTSLTAQRNIIPLGEWKLIEYAGSEDLTFEDFSECFWCQLGEEKSFKLNDKNLHAELNGALISYQYEIVNNQLILFKEQTIQVSTEEKGTEVQTSIGQTIFDFNRKGKKLFLVEANAQNKNSYTFLLSK